MDGKGKRSLVEVTEERLIEMIREQKLKAGDRLENEYELAKNLQVGRSTLREAVKGLESRNVVTIRRGAGTFVSSKGGVPEDPLGISLMDKDENIALELLEVRMILEPESAALAAMNATEEDVLSIEKQCRKVEGMIKKGMEYRQEDIRFHQLVARATKNRIIIKLIPIIHQSVGLTIEMTNRSLTETTVLFHRQIVDAIRRKDARGAKSAMTAHMSDNRIYIIKEMERKRRLEQLYDKSRTSDK